LGGRAGGGGGGLHQQSLKPQANKMFCHVKWLLWKHLK